MSCAEVFPNQMKKVQNKGINFGTLLCNVQCSLQQFIRNFPSLICIMQTVPASNLTFMGQQMLKELVQNILCPQVKYALTETICMEFKLTRRILATQFANHTHNSVWETLAQCTEIARIGALFEAYTRERSWNSTGDTLNGPCYLSRDVHKRKIKP
jgi:hypothetical protein